MVVQLDHRIDIGLSVPRQALCDPFPHQGAPRHPAPLGDGTDLREHRQWYPQRLADLQVAVRVAGGLDRLVADLRLPVGNVLAGQPPGEEVFAVPAVHRSPWPNALIHLALPRNPASNAAKISRAPSSRSSCSQTSMSLPEAVGTRTESMSSATGSSSRGPGSLSAWWTSVGSSPWARTRW